MRLITTLATCGIAAAVALGGSASAQTVCTPDITDATPLGPVAGCDRIWGDEPDEAFIVLDSIVFVIETELTILPGTIVRGQPRNTAFMPGTPLAGAPGTLVVPRGSFLNARGTAGAPIVFTTAAVDNDNDGIPDDVSAAGGQVPGDGNPDDWTPGDLFLDDTPLANPLAPLFPNGEQAYGLHGGIVLMGFAPTNLDASATGNIGEGLCEGLPVPGVLPGGSDYGGGEPHDSSGHLEYVSVRHAGDEIDDANELNGITLCGVGDGTIMRNIEGYANDDDGIEMFGGTVNFENVVIAYVGDDSIDVDQGYTGVIQDALTLHIFFDENDGDEIGTGGSGGSAGEFDGEDCPACFPGPAPFVVPQPNMVITNWTSMGNVEGGLNGGITNPAVDANTDNQGLDADSSWCGVVANSLFIGYEGGAEPALEGSPHGVANGRPCSYLVASSGDGILAEDWPAAAARGDLQAEGPGSGGDPQGEEEFIHGDPDGTTCPAGSACNRFPVAGYQFLVNENHYFRPTGVLAGGRAKLLGSKTDDAGVIGGAPFDPRPATPGDPEVSGGVEPQWPGTDRSETYKGAFPDSADELWLEPWSVLAIGGLID